MFGFKMTWWEMLGSSPTLMVALGMIGYSLQEPLAPYLPPWASTNLPMLFMVVVWGIIAYVNPAGGKKVMAKPGDEAPDFQIELSDKRRTRLQTLRKEEGKPVFVAFVMRCLPDSDELCPHCPIVTAEIEQLAKGKFKDKVKFLILNLQGKFDCEAFKDKEEWKVSDSCEYGWLDIAARADIMHQYEIKFVPSMFVMDKEGLVYKCGLGKEYVEQTLNDFFKDGAKAPALDNETDKNKKKKNKKKD